MFYDTHAHVYPEEFGENYDDIIKNSLQSGVWFNNVGTNKNSSAEVVRIAEFFEQGVYAAVGLHPNYVSWLARTEKADNIFESFDYDYYFNLARKDKVVGIGECGLDYYRIKDSTELDLVRRAQSVIFIEQLNLAKDLKKVLIIHCRASKNTSDAYEDILKLLEQNPAGPFEIHSFTANWGIAERFLNLGAYLGLNGIITFDKTGSLDEVVRKMPLDRILLETDAPYLAPVPFRGKKNEPAHVKYVSEFVAKIRGIEPDLVAETTFENAKKLFLSSAILAQREI